eukprot:gene7218-12899_t
MGVRETSSHRLLYLIVPELRIAKDVIGIDEVPSIGEVGTSLIIVVRGNDENDDKAWVFVMVDDVSTMLLDEDCVCRVLWTGGTLEATVTGIDHQN